MTAKFLMVASLVLAQGACALSRGGEAVGSGVPSSTSWNARGDVPAGGARCTGEAPSRYNREQIAEIMRLRDEGESLAAIAGRVGGSRSEVKVVEVVEKARLRGRPVAVCAPRSTTGLLAQVTGGGR
jgi:hypothetical protein